MRDDRKIEQFRQMAEADPDNELGHFSLGRALLEAGAYADAARSLARVLELNPRMSKAWQILAEAQHGAGDLEAAIKTATKGVTISDGQGDRMPRDAMAAMLREWGAEVPAFQTREQASPEQGTSAAGFQCVRCGRPSGQLAKAPFKGPMGQKIFDRVCSACWKEWIGMGTKVINELGLQLSTKAGQDAYDQYMVEFLQLDQS